LLFFLADIGVKLQLRRHLPWGKKAWGSTETQNHFARAVFPSLFLLESGLLNLELELEVELSGRALA
jgi:hypothetical protein